jgi:hypothetical protein
MQSVLLCSRSTEIQVLTIHWFYSTSRKSPLGDAGVWFLRGNSPRFVQERGRGGNMRPRWKNHRVIHRGPTQAPIDVRSSYYKGFRIPSVFVDYRPQDSTAIENHFVKGTNIDEKHIELLPLRIVRLSFSQASTVGALGRETAEDLEINWQRLATTVFARLFCSTLSSEDLRRLRLSVSWSSPDT